MRRTGARERNDVRSVCHFILGISIVRTRISYPILSQETNVVHLPTCPKLLTLLENEGRRYLQLVSMEQGGIYIVLVLINY